MAETSNHPNSQDSLNSTDSGSIRSSLASRVPEFKTVRKSLRSLDEVRVQSLDLAVPNLVERLGAEQASENTAKTGAWYRPALLIALPCVLGLAGFGFQMAHRQHTGFFVLSPLVVAHVILLCGLIAQMFVAHGTDEVKLLFNRKYIHVMFGSLLGAGRAILQNLAIEHIDSSVFFAIMKSCVLWCAIIETCYLKQLPDKLKALSIAGVLLSISAYALGSMQGGAVSTPLVPLILAVLASILGASSDVFFVVASSAFTRDIENKRAEMSRYMIAGEIWKITLLVIVLFATEGRDIIDKGIFHGWKLDIALLTILPVVLSHFVVSFSLVEAGAVYVNMATSFDMGVAYFLEVIFGISTFSASSAVQIFVIANLVITSSVHTVHEQLKILESHSGVIKAIRSEIKANSQLFEDVGQSSRVNSPMVPDPEEAAPFEDVDVSVSSWGWHSVGCCLIRVE